MKEIPLERMNLRGNQSVIVWELWEEAQHTNAKDGVLRVAVKPHSIKTLRITPFEKGRTALVGSSFHYTMGALEITDVKSTERGGLALRISRPTPEAGRCAFWSAQKQAVIAVPVKAAPEGAEIKVS